MSNSEAPPTGERVPAPQQTTPAERSTAKPARSKSVWSRIRWSCAIAVVVAGVVVTAHGWKVCSEEIPPTSTKPVLVCKERGSTDPTLLAGLILALLLIWPDLSQLDLPGGISLRRKVEEQEARIETQRARTEALAQHISLLQSQQQVAAAGAQAIVVLANAEDIREDLPGKTRRFLALSGAPGAPDLFEPAEEAPEVAVPPPGEARAADLSRDDLERDVIALWREIGTLVRRANEAETFLKTGIGTAAVNQLVESKGPEAVDELLRWRDLFDRETELVQAARSAVLVGQPISDESLAAAVDVGRRLVALAPTSEDDRQGRPTAPSRSAEPKG